MKLKVSEHFLSVQGEGPTVGLPSVFLRLTGCNLTCGGQCTVQTGLLDSGATWRCDTIDVWTKGISYDLASLLQIFEDCHYLSALSWGAHLVITGGEPLLQQKEIGAFLDLLYCKIGAAITVEIETNGSIMPESSLRPYVSYWNVSPKLKNSGMLESRRIFPNVLSHFSFDFRSIFKFVVSDEKDVYEVQKKYVQPFQLDASVVYLMPAVDSLFTLNLLSLKIKRLSLEYGYTYSSRLQIAMWDQTTGV